MEESKAKESVMETQIMALRARLEDKSQLSEKEICPVKSSKM